MKKETKYPSPISGQSKLLEFLTVTKSVLKAEYNAHITINIYHKQKQSIPKGHLQKPSKPEGSKKLFTYIPMQATRTTKTVIRCQKDLKLVRCVLAFILFFVRKFRDLKSRPLFVLY